MLLQPNQWAETLVALGARWRLIYTAPSKDVTAAVKGQNGGAGEEPVQQLCLCCGLNGPSWLPTVVGYLDVTPCTGS